MPKGISLGVPALLRTIASTAEAIDQVATPSLLWRAAIGGAAIIGAWLAASAWAADPQTYKVRLEGAVSKEIENTLSVNSDLVSLRSSAPVSPMGLILRARGDIVRLKTVLESYGYYQSVITVSIDGDALTGADVADKLAALPKGKNASVVVSFVPGPQYVLGKVRIDGDRAQIVSNLTFA